MSEPSTQQTRLAYDVAALCAGPRHRAVPGSLEAARRYCAGELERAGWRCTEHPFTVASAVRMSDAGRPGTPLALHWTGRLQGVNLIAVGPGRTGPQLGDLLVVAHLDTVRQSPGADDNASGVAAALETARLLAGSEHRVTIAFVDLEEIGYLGSRHLARTLPRPGLVVCLESVGFFDDAPGGQRLPAGFGLVFPDLAREIRAEEERGNFLLVIHRSTSAEFAHRWTGTAAALGLRALQLRDPRWNGRGQAITHWVNPLLMDLDRSDHVPFWRRGVPALVITGTAPLRNRRYHRADDTADTLDYRRLGVLADSLASTLRAAPSAF